MTPQDRYARLVRACQRDHRIPALSVAIHRADRPAWTLQVGASGTDRPLDEATQFRMGSVTKTFTAVLVMQCRDDGLLDLDDRLDAHLSVPAHGEATIRRMLSHTSGLQREPYGDVWETMAAPEIAEMIADMERVERVLPGGRRWHYSNLAYSLLGELVARLRGETWAQALAERILTPLKLGTIALSPEHPAVGYMVDAYSDEAWAEPVTQERGVAPAGRLWGTPADLARWAGFLADPAALDPDGAVLAPQTLAEMRYAVAPTSDEAWPLAFGLGLMLRPDAATGAYDIGHTGAMPGFLTGAWGRRGGGDGRPKALAAVAMGSSSAAGAIVTLPHALMDAVVEHDPADLEPWTVGTPVPADLAGVIGRWWTEGRPIGFFYLGGTLSARYEGVSGAPSMEFEALGGDEFRCVSGPETGERLRVNRDPATGAVVSMNFATYRVSRQQEAFGSPRS